MVPLPLLVAEEGPVVRFVARVQRILQPFPDRESWRKDEEAADESVVVRCRVPVVGCLPKNEHGHDRSFSCCGGHLVGYAVYANVVLVVDAPDFVSYVPSRRFVQVDVGQRRVELGEIQFTGVGVGPVVIRSRVVCVAPGYPASCQSRTALRMSLTSFSGVQTAPN